MLSCEKSKTATSSTDRQQSRWKGLGLRGVEECEYHQPAGDTRTHLVEGDTMTESLERSVKAHSSG